MTLNRYVIGLDFGTGSARALLVDTSSGASVAGAEYTLETLLCDGDQRLARQRPQDYLNAMRSVVVDVLRQAGDSIGSFRAEQVVGIGVDSTGSTPIPVDRRNRALSELPEFSGNLNAQAWLWKDHTASLEAREITRSAADWNQPFLETCGGAYSSEWFWAKIWRCLQVDRQVFNAAYSWVECCDWLAARLAGIESPRLIKRGACAAGHKALFDPRWGGLPPAGFLRELDPALSELRGRLYDQVFPVGTSAGGLSEEWANSTGLQAGIPISVANLDAHAGAIGAGVSEGKLVKILGTSSCDCAVMPLGQQPQIEGISGIASDSIVPGYHGIEAGQSAVGDIFAWFVEKLCEGSSALHEELSQSMSRLQAGESGLVALDWLNGNRCVIADSELTGQMFGISLHTTRAEMYRAWVEATAFGARVILERLADSGVGVREIICCGGVAARNPVLMQIYADITGCVLWVADSDESCALGSAIAAATASGDFADIPAAQNVMSAARGAKYSPVEASSLVYDKLYRVYRQLHDAAGLGKPLDLRATLYQLKEIQQGVLRDR